VPVESVNSPKLLRPRGYAHAVVASGGKTVYIGGQVPAGADGVLVGEGDYTVQAEQAMRNLAYAVEGAGGTGADLVKLTIYVVDCTEKNEERTIEGFGAAAREVGLGRIATMIMGVTMLGFPGALVEIDGIAVIDAGTE
jgi:enamine deaminase RidA (YjgF/YER057c/UK114 family)